MVEVKSVPGPGRKNLDVLIKGFGDRQGKVGYLDKSQYDDGTPVAYVAAIQEFGAPTKSIPPRSFIRTTIMDEKQNWGKLVEQGAKQTLKGSQNPEKVLDSLVLQAKGDIQAKISSIHSPELSPITLGIRKVKMGQVPGLDPNKVSGKTVGIVAGMIKDGSLNVSGVPKKPLIEPPSIAGAGTLHGSIDGVVE